MKDHFQYHISQVQVKLSEIAVTCRKDESAAPNVRLKKISSAFCVAEEIRDNTAVGQCREGADER